MLSQESHTKALEALNELKKLVNSTANLSLADKIRLTSTYKTISDALTEGTTPTTVPVTVTTQTQPDSLYEDTKQATVTTDRKEQTKLLQTAMEQIAKGRSVLSGFIKQDDTTIVSINSPTGYNQPIENIFNKEIEQLRMVVSTNTMPYFVTYSQKTKLLSLTASKYWKTPAAT